MNNSPGEEKKEVLTVENSVIAEGLAAHLIRMSAWFQAVPWPNDEWRFAMKSDAIDEARRVARTLRDFV